MYHCSKHDVKLTGAFARLKFYIHLKYNIRKAKCDLLYS